MAHWFEDVTKTLGDDKIGRRTAIRRIAGTVGGVAIASALPGIALAKTNKHCPTGAGTCSNPNFPNCVGISNTNCFCFTGLNGKAVCGCNGFCCDLPNCSGSQKCPRGSVCIVANGCNCGFSAGVCIPNYVKKKNRNCQLGSSHEATDTTAAGVL